MVQAESLCMGMELRYGVTLISSKLTGLLISMQESCNGKKEGDGQPKMRTATVSNKPSTAAKSGVIYEFSGSDVHSQSESETVLPGNING